MATRPTDRANRSNGYVRGNLAYDYDYLERERQRRVERERHEYEERREYAPQPRPQPRRKPAAMPRHRERIRVSPLALLGFATLAVMTVVLLGSYAKLTTASHEVALMRGELADLEKEHAELLDRYEKTFDLEAIQTAAEAAGMAKPSASQVYYFDLSEPDGVVLYSEASTNALGHVLASIGQETAALLEYFK